MLSRRTIRLCNGERTEVWAVVPKSLSGQFGYYAAYCTGRYKQAIGRVRGFAVFHAPSGLTILTGLPSIWACRGLIGDLAGLPGVDWSFTEQGQVPASARPAIKAIIRRYEDQLTADEPRRLFHLPRHKTKHEKTNHEPATQKVD